MKIFRESIQAVLPDAAVREALKTKPIGKPVTVIAIGKAAWNMAKAARDILGDQITQGLVITKNRHSKGMIQGIEIMEAGHPVPDENSVLGACRALEMVSKLTEEDLVLFLISGGGSALFEMPLEGLTLGDIMGITQKLLAVGADIREINTVRKHLSQVKGGRFAEACQGAEIYAVVLSDVIGDPLDVIASGPVFPDASTSREALAVLEKYQIPVEDKIRKALALETPKQLPQCESVIAGSVAMLCQAAARSSESLGYHPLILSTSIDCEAREAGKILAAIGRDVLRGEGGRYMPTLPCAIIAGGETVVHIRGKGMGGRNQEAALSAAIGIEGHPNIAILTAGSDGTDGPTEAAGGLVDGETAARIRKTGLPEDYLNENDSLNALNLSGDLIVTGATGTNVNDLMLILICKA